METILKHITCGHTNHTYSKYLEFNFSKEDKILEVVRRKASELTNTLNPKDPSGKIRSLEDHTASVVRGALAEICSKHILEKEIKSRNLKGFVKESEGLVNTSDGTTEIDLQLVIDGKHFDIEVRSSCVRNGTEFGIRSGYFNIIGWYITSSKSFEPPKDFYLMYLFPFNANETISKIKDKFVMHFVGGATKAMLEGPLGRYKTLKQDGAKYCGISPICAGLDSLQVIEKMTQKRCD